MKKLSYLLPILLLAFVISLVVSSCAEPPDVEIMAAEDAIKNAINANAEDLSPRLLNKAQKLLQEAKMLNEQGKFAEAKKKAQYAILRAEKAVKNSDRLDQAQRQKQDEDFEDDTDTDE